MATAMSPCDGDRDRALLRRMFDAAVAAAQPDRTLAAALPPRPRSGRVVIVGGGKASAAMAAALEAAWGPCEGLVVTRYGHGAPCAGIEIVEAAHPEPDSAGREAARRVLALADGLSEGDTMVALISGGASALLSLPACGISDVDNVGLNRSLLASGATIHEMNIVRRHASAISGGRLALAAWPAQVLTLAISDVPGDDPADIGSGPTVGDPSTLADAMAVIARYAIGLPDSVLTALGDLSNETPLPDDARLSASDFRLIATPQKSLEAAASVAEIPCILLGDAIEGEAREVGRVMAGIARATAAGRSSFPAPCILLSGGETSVTIRQGADGCGGRNVEFLMGFAQTIVGVPDVTALACDTDGIDGAAELAGAFADGSTFERALAAGLSLCEAIHRHDGHGLFSLWGTRYRRGQPAPTSTTSGRSWSDRRAPVPRKLANATSALSYA